MITERRQHPRKTPLEFTFIQLEQEYAGHVLNYSKEGLSFETTAPISDSDLVQFWLSFRQLGQIDGVGRITWLNEKKNRGGIAFVHLSRTSREKVDEWAAAPQGVVAAVPHKTDDEESPAEIVSKIMEQVLTEKRHSPVGPLHSGKPADEEGSATVATASQTREAERIETSNSPASALLTPSDTTEQLAGDELHTLEPSEACTTVATPEIAATSEECVGLWQADAAPTEPLELEPPENGNAFAPPALTPSTAETGDLWGVAGPIAREETWHVDCASAIDAPTQSPLEETPMPSATSSVTAEADDAAATNDTTATSLESVSPAPAVRKWPPAAPLESTTPIEQIQGARREDSSQEETRELVPLKQYLHTQRLQFVRGAAIGILLALVIAITVFKFSKPARQVGLPDETRNAVAANSTMASGATMPEPTPPAALIPESKGSESSPQKGQNAISSRKPPLGRADVTAPDQPLRNSGATSSDGAAPSSSQDSSNAPANAIPRPSSFAYRNSPAESGSQPLFNLTQRGNSDAPAAEAESGQPKVGVDLGSTPWSFHRRNIHGTPPVGGELRPAELLSSVAPHYPEAAKARQVSGDVVIDAIIDTRGNVRKPRVLSGPTLLRSAALNAVVTWKYKPALLDGKPTEVRETITVKFLPQ